MISSNEAWAGIQWRYSKLLEDFDVVNEQRCEVMKREMAGVVRFFNKLTQSDEVENQVRQFEGRRYVHY